MTIFGRFKVKKALGALRALPDTQQPQYTQGIMQLKLLGPAVLPLLFEALREGPTELLVSVLTALLNDTSLPAYLDGLSHPHQPVVEAVAGVLRDSHHYDANQLLPLLTQTKVPRRVVAGILMAHKDEFHAPALWNLVHNATLDNRTAVFHFLGQVATLDMIPELIQQTGHTDWFVRMHMARILSAFHTTAVQEALVRLANDHDRNVRMTALEGLAKFPPPFAAVALCPLLRDPDLLIQSKAIETVVQSRDPEVFSPVLAILQDQSEYVRRAAVEVVQSFSHTNALKDLLAALREEDWWARVRAVDALGHIDSPQVMAALLPLLQDQDEFIRRCAIEIVSTTQGERALQYLLATLEAPDWAVRERAVEALVHLDNVQALPALLRVIATDAGVTSVAIRAVAALGDPRFIAPLLEKLPHAEAMLSQEILRALETLTEASQATSVQHAIQAVLPQCDMETRSLAQQVLRTLIENFGEQRRQSGHSTATRASMPTRLDVEQAVRQASAAARAPSVSRPLSTMSPLPGRRRRLDIATLQPGVVVAERYRIIRQVGEGGFGIVMLVHDMIINEDIVLKFLNPVLAEEEEILKRFVHELRYTRRLTHNNIIRIYDFVTFDDAFAISMEYFPSHSLQEELRPLPPLDRKRGLRIFGDICRGLHVAHRAGIVHRDLKPQNILINDQCAVKIVDFGLAVALLSSSARLTGNDALIGTPTYMAPEQILPRGKVDTRTDIYSLGVLMYEMFTGKQPYRGHKPVDVLIQHTKGNVVAPRQMVPDFPVALEAIILKAMAVTPNRRFQSVAALEESLAACCAQEG